MPIVKNGKVAVALRYIDEQGVEHQVVQVRLGDKMVWDGTAPAFVSMPRLAATAAMRVPGVSAGQSFGVPAAAVTSEFRTPTVSAGARISMPRFTATGQLYAPGITAAAYVQVLAATAQGEVLPVSAGEAAPGAVYMPVITATAGLLPPVVVVPAEVQVQLLTAVGEVLTPIVGGQALAQAVAATASGQVLPPLLSAGQTQATPRATATAGMLTPTVSAGATISMPVITATGQMIPPQSTVPMGINKNGSQNVPGGSYTTLTSWTVRSGYPDTVISGNGIAPRPGTYNFSFTASWINGRQMRMQILKNGTQVGFIDSGSNVETLTCTASNITIASGDIVTFTVNPTASRDIDGGSTRTYATCTPVA